MEQNNHKDGDELSISTLCAHAGIPKRTKSQSSKSEVDEQPQTLPKSHSSPIWQTSVYDFYSVEESIRAFTPTGYGYRRYSHPNANELSEAVAKLEGAECGFATSSGMGAIVSAILSVCNPGDLVISQQDPYGGTYSLLKNDVARFGVDVHFDNIRDVQVLENLLRHDGAEPNSSSVTEGLGNNEIETSNSMPTENSIPAQNNSRNRRNVVVFIETISNPLLEEPDVVATVNLCRRFGATLIVDNTFATMLRIKPIQLGADIVIHSVTKFLGGHSDLVAGVLVGSSRHIIPASQLASRMGLIVAPLDAWLAVRGLSTLHVRMERSWATSAELSNRLKSHSKVLRVKSLDRCAVICFEISGGFNSVDLWISSLRMITLCPSLGGTTTTASHPASSSHVALSKQGRERAGISDGMIRLSIGLESVDDLWNDLIHAFDALT